MCVLGAWPWYNRIVERHRQRDKLWHEMSKAVYILNDKSTELKKAVTELYERIVLDGELDQPQSEFPGNPLLERFCRLRDKAYEIQTFLSNRSERPDVFTDSDLDLIVPFMVQLESLRVTCPDPRGIRSVDEWKQFLRIILGYMEAEDLSGAQERDWNADFRSY